MSRMVAEIPIQTERPYALTIAGLDPCAGAGILADTKVFEACAVYGLGVCTALTMQHDADFRQVEWVPLPTIIAQCKPLVERYPIWVVKIGLIESLFVLTELLDWLTDSPARCAPALGPHPDRVGRFSFSWFDGLGFPAGNPASTGAADAQCTRG